MKHKLKYSLDETVIAIDFSQDELNNLNEDLALFDQFDPDFVLLENIEPIEEIAQVTEPDLLTKSVVQINNVIPIRMQNKNSTTRRASSDIETRMASALDDITAQRMQIKPLPIALRKRLMYQRAINA